MPNEDVQDRISNWPHKWFGFWGAPQRPINDFRCPTEFADRSWDPGIRAQVIEYLSKCRPGVATTAASLNCQVCGCKLPGGSYRFDGEWLWPTDLVHYIEEHDVRVPIAFEDHIRRRNYQPPLPESVDVPFADWPWPNTLGSL